MLRYYFKIFNINKEGEYLIHLNTKNNLENRIKRKRFVDVYTKLQIFKLIEYDKILYNEI